MKNGTRVQTSMGPGEVVSAWVDEGLRHLVKLDDSTTMSPFLSGLHDRYGGLYFLTGEVWVQSDPGEEVLR